MAIIILRCSAATVPSPTDGWMIAGGYQTAYDYPIDTTEEFTNGEFVSGKSVR